ncbi:hypothetical protein ACFV0O_41430 [Kitasatospora sp. NPDC059577]|uniref:hypothetical protein n=1 Tax=Kitasatospora sp. NPDC059577 TaxID=3346873 RepID=UPI0036CEE8FD
MHCDVCEHEMTTWDRPPSRWCREFWLCTWCHAVTLIGTPDHEAYRPDHSPWDIRWEAAWTDMLPDADRHAYGFLHRTLCGIEKPDMTGSQFGTWGDFLDACPDCTAAALAIDARWPEERRAGFRVSVPAAPRPRPEDQPGYVRPADELGRPDVRLPPTPTGPGRRTRVLTASPGPPAHAPAEYGFRRIGDGPAAVRLPAFWAGCGIGPYRPYDKQGRTFAWFRAYPLDTIPPLDEESFVGDFAWFGDTGDPLDHRTAVTDPIAAELAAVGLTLPADFLALITRANLHRCLDREGGGCWTDVAGPLPSPVDPADRMVLFFRDQQSCVLWYLYLHHDGQSGVVCSARDFTREPEPCHGPDGEIVTPGREIFWTAPSVEHFAYRFLTEARLAAAIHDRARAGELDPELVAYLAHYVPGSGSGTDSLTDGPTDRRTD